MTLKLPEGTPQKVRAGAVAAVLGVGRTTVRAMVGRGILPRPLRLSSRLHLFDRDEIQAALDRLAEGGAA